MPKGHFIVNVPLLSSLDFRSFRRDAAAERVRGTPSRYTVDMTKDNEQRDPSATLVGILSDTHGRLPDAALAALAECDHIIHAGDIGAPEILWLLETLAPITAVRGNNDFDEYGKQVQKAAHPVIAGVRFLVTHYPQDAKIGWNGGRYLAPGDPIPQVCVHGHTHIPEIITGKEARPAQYFLCPGSVSLPRGSSKPSIIKMLLEDATIRSVRLEEL